MFLREYLPNPKLQSRTTIELDIYMYIDAFIHIIVFYQSLFCFYQLILVLLLCSYKFLFSFKKISHFNTIAKSNEANVLRIQKCLLHVPLSHQTQFLKIS